MDLIGDSMIGKSKEIGMNIVCHEFLHSDISFRVFIIVLTLSAFKLIERKTD